MRRFLLILRILAIAILLPALLSACSQTASRQSAARPEISKAEPPCCRKLEPYPKWLIRVLEPAAPLVGRTVALVEWRKGYMEKEPQALAEMRSKLRPLDIIVVANKGRLSGYTIPGLFSHGAAYLGGEAELKRLGIWNDKAVVPFHQAIRDGKTMIESDQKGVHLSKPIDVLGSDRVVILRPRYSCRAARQKVGRAFFEHLGTKFDFHFNSDDDRKLYCVELIDHVLGAIQFPQREIYRRQTIVPDDIMIGVSKRTLPLDVIAYYRAGPHGWEKADARSLRTDIDDYWMRRKKVRRAR